MYFWGEGGGGLVLNVPVNSYGHVMTSFHLTTLFLNMLDQAVNQYFMLILSVVSLGSDALRPSQQQWSCRDISSYNHTYSWAILTKPLTCTLCTYHHLYFWGLMLYILVNSYGHVGMLGSPNHTFFLSNLD